MRPLFAIFSARFRLLLQYRAAALAGVTTQIAWGFFISMGLQAFYRGSAEAQPIPFYQLTSYIWLGQAFFAMLPWLPDSELRAAVRSGNVGYDLLRPIDLYSFWLARALAARTAPTLLRAIPLLTLAFAFFGLHGPPSTASGLAFGLALLGAVVLSATFTVLVNISLFWTISGEGVAQAMPAIVPFLAGNILPLPLFPTWMQPILSALPFRGIVDAPFRLYSGHLAASDLGGVVIHQWTWIAIFILLGRWLFNRGVRRIVVQGG